MEKILEGDLSRFAVPDLLLFLNMGRHTAALVLERPEQETKLYFLEGRPVFATSTRDELRFGHVLVRLGKATPRDVEGAVLRKRAGGWRLGQLFVSNKVLSEPELEAALKVQVSEVIFDAFAWREGVFTVFDKVPPPATAVTLDTQLQSLILEGARRLDERERLGDLLPNQDLVVEALVNPERVKHAVSMTPEEWQVFFLVDDRRTLRDICRLAGNPDEAATLLVLRRLLAAKFVALGEQVLQPTVPNPPADADGEGTTVAPPEPLPAGGYSVLFGGAGARPRPPQDDTRQVVNPQAVHYLADARRLTIARLILVQDGVETSSPLTRDAYTIGRHRNNDIVVGDPKVSSFHARIDREAEGFVAVDLNSRNGTFVNGRRVTRQSLTTGDELRVGATRLLYKVDYTSAV